MNFAHEGDTIFATWFTYDVDGKPMWLVATAPKTGPGTYAGTLYRTTGPAFNAVPFNPASVVPTQVGAVTISFTDGNTGTFAYTVNGVSQTKAVTRQVFGSPGTICQYALSSGSQRDHPVGFGAVPANSQARRGTKPYPVPRLSHFSFSPTLMASRNDEHDHASGVQAEATDGSDRNLVSSHEDVSYRLRAELRHRAGDGIRLQYRGPVGDNAESASGVGDYAPGSDVR